MHIPKILIQSIDHICLLFFYFTIIMLLIEKYIKFTWKREHKVYFSHEWLDKILCIIPTGNINKIDCVVSSKQERCVRVFSNCKNIQWFSNACSLFIKKNICCFRKEIPFITFPYFHMLVDKILFFFLEQNVDNAHNLIQSLSAICYTFLILITNFAN